LSILPDCNGYRFIKLTKLSPEAIKVEAGHEIDGKPFYICRVYHEGHLLIGKSIPDDNICYVGMNGVEKLYQDNFSILTHDSRFSLRWQTIFRRPHSPFLKEIRGGRTKDRETIYIGRCSVTAGNESSLIPGFYLDSNLTELLIPWNGGVTKCTQFQSLICIESV